MDQPIFQGALPILSNLLGDNTVAGLMAAFNLALNTVTATTAALNNYNSNSQNARQGSSFKSQDYGDYRGEQAFYGQEGQDDNQGQQFQSVIMSTLAMVFSTVNSAFSSLTASQTPLTTYILVAVLSYVAFRIIYGLVSWVVRSVLNLIKISIMITAVATILWFVVNVTSSTGGSDTGHQDPISQVLYSLQGKFRAEYERQQQYLQNQHVY
ncbi:hypothetical protein EDD21DRAFT_377570 [Dissophora ornata]|nr:hypothetical protein BGZ58_005630 [Dissophora ornata]KAI8600307.1 hypothetical protein EDD21DRAFT_377570 [Dissophora ornata]